jgi:hypothetical protein
MVGAEATGILVIQGAADPTEVVRTVMVLEEGGIAETAVLASSSSAAREIEAGLPSPIAAVESMSSAGPSVPTLLRSFGCPFVGAVLAGEEMDLEGVVRRTEGLASHPHLVMAVGHQAGPGPEAEGPEPEDAEGPRGVDGRAFAHRVLVEGGAGLRHPGTVTFRRNAIGVGAPPTPGEGRETNTTDWCLPLSLRVLRSGGVWIDDNVGAGIPRPSTTESADDLEQWPSILKLAIQIGLIGDRNSATEALVAHSRRVACAARVGLAAGDHFPAEVTTTLQAVNSLWQAEDAQRDAEEGQLALHVVVCLSSGEHDDTTIGAAVTLGTEVTVIGPQAPDHAAAHGAHAGPSITSAAEIEGAVATVVETSKLPVLLMLGGELPVVMNHHQIAAFLEESGWEAAALCAPEGWITRLWRGGRSATGSAPVHGVAGTGVVSPGGPAHLPVVQSLQLISVGAEGSADWWLQGEGLTAKPHHLRRFVIAAPDYTDIHGGVVAMHRLCDRLNRIGYEAFIEPLGDATGITRNGWLTPLWWRQNFEGTVMVYPEIVTGNPLGAQWVVRWLLNRPAWFTGSEMDEDGDDLIVAFSPQIAPEKPVLNVPLFDPTVFFPKDVEGQGGLLWIGKGVVPPDFDRSDLTLITNDWPTSRQAMADLLRNAEVLYSCDWLTTIIGESLMCGTRVVLVGNQTWRREDIAMWPGMTWEDQEPPSDARAEVSRFVDDYRRSVGWSDQIVEDFVRTVNEHFSRHPNDSWDPTDLGPTLPSYSSRITAGLR